MNIWIVAVGDPSLIDKDKRLQKYLKERKKV